MSPECHWHRFLNKIISTTTASIDLTVFFSKVTLALGVRVGSFVTKDISGVTYEGMRGQEVLATAVSLGGTDKRPGLPIRLIQGPPVPNPVTPGTMNKQTHSAAGNVYLQTTQNSRATEASRHHSPKATVPRTLPNPRQFQHGRPHAAADH